MWRLCCGALPTSKGMHKRVMEVKPWCVRCKQSEESGLHHAVWGSDFVQGVWEEARIQWLDECPEVGSELDWVGWWCGALSDEERRSVAMMAWMNWNERNAVMHGREPRHPGEIVGATMLLMQAYDQVREGEGVSETRCEPRCGRVDSFGGRPYQDQWSCVW